MTTGAATPRLPEAGFWEVELADSSTGWVDSRDLRVPAAWRAPLVEQPCTLTEDLAQGLTELAGKAGSTADHVFALDYGRGDACDRLVVIFGAGGSFANDPPWPHSLAAAVPTGITVLTRAAGVEIVLPPQIAAVRPTTTECRLDDGAAFVARNTSGGLSVMLHFETEKRLSSAVLHDPARLVIDLRDAPSLSGPSPGPIVGRSVAITEIESRGAPGEALVPEIRISGYARPLEANGALELRMIAEQSRGGQPVAATFLGTDYLGTLRDVRYGFTTNDYIDAWGQLAFVIGELDPGAYELFVGERSAKDASPIGIFLPIEIGD